MKILLADSLSPSCIASLERGGHEIINAPTVGGDTLLEALREAQPQALVVRSTKVPGDGLVAAPSLELIVRAGAGYDNIDVETASGRGIFVANCPGKNASAVAELTLALILSIDRSIPDNVLDAREGRWNKKKYASADGIRGKTLGVIGLGNIGKEVVERAKAFDVSVIGWSRSLTEERAEALGLTYCASPIEVAAGADIISLHVASKPETENLADRAFFEAMKPGAYFINTTRSAVVDEDALVWAMDHKGVRAGLDVFSDEPAYKEGAFSHRLAEHPAVYLSHHIGASTQQAQEAIANEAARVINTYAETGDVPNCVNKADQSPATHQLTVRHLDKVGVLAAVLDDVSKAGWNVQEMQNLVFAGAKAACAYIRFDGKKDDAVISRIAQHPDVLAVSIIDL